MRLLPLRDGILVRPRKAEERTSSGIIIPDSAQERPVQGNVLSVGDGITMLNGNVVPTKVAVNDEILFRRNAGVEVTVDDESLLLLSESEVLAILYLE
jgi:chaperonin GroES